MDALNQDWKKVAIYFNRIGIEWLREYFNSHPNVKFSLHEETELNIDFIRNITSLDLFGSIVNLFDEVVEKKNLSFMKDTLPRPFRHKGLAEELVNHIINHDPEAFEKYKTEIFNDWQRKWIYTITNVKRQFIELNIMDFGKKPLFMINAYISEFELLHNFILIPFTNDILLEETSYRNRLNVFSHCINILEFDDDIKNGLLLKLKEIFEPNKRNSLVKHNYFFEEESNIIHLFSPDAFVRKYKPYGELNYGEFIRLVITMKAIFWIMIREISQRSSIVKAIVDGLISSYPPFFDVIEQYILNPKLSALLKLIIDCFPRLSVSFVTNLEKRYNEEILQYQLLESFLILRILFGSFLKPDIIPNRKVLTNFSMFQKITVHHAMMKMRYLVTYEEIMQIIVHPFTEMLFGEIYKDFSLRKLRKLENGKYSILFEELNKDLRDSLAHNNYFFEEKDGWVYTKYGKALKSENIKLTSSQQLFNYVDITNAVFPFLAEAPTELATAQLINDLFNRESVFTPNKWLEKEKFALNHANVIFAGMTRIRLGILYANEDNYNEVSNTIRELFKDNDSYKNLTCHDLEIILSFSFRFISNIKSRLVVKTLTKRIIKKKQNNNEKKRLFFILLFLASLQKDRREMKRITKRIKKFNNE